MVDRLRELLATFFHIGHIGAMPGTFGSMAAVAIFVIAGRPLAGAGWAALGALVVVSAFSLSRCKAIFGTTDPGAAVIDEVAGMWLTMLAGGSASLILIFTGFFLFRFFDILKPFPISRLERLPGWAGVLADDLAAGLAAGILVRLAAAYTGL